MNFIDKNVSFDMIWEDSETAGIDKAECKKCGYKEDYSEDCLAVHSGSKWLCRNCGYEVEFVWYGMGWKQSHDHDNKMHKNIDELIKK